VHIFDFSADIYGAYVDVTFLQKIRDEHRFESFEALKAQIARDVEQAKAFFAR
jgi:riboflavin kinase/FMN adenylyltransferase